ncbi:MAG: hypothetical protein ABI639_11535 [Thermoanaerobaculia bacterium]
MSSRFGFVFLVALSLALACTVGFAVAPASYDDGYITYRYAQNLAAGRGLVLNPGETVLGTSAPGYALVLAGVAFVLRPFGVEVAHVGAGMFLLAMASLPVLLAGILRRLETRHPELTACMFALLAIPARWNVELMGCEQVPILALLALAFLLALSGHDLAAGAAAGIAGALRNDAGFAIAALAFALWINRRRIPVRFAVSALVPVVAVWSWLLATFGTILPVSLAGKQAEMEFVHGGYGTAELAWLLRSTSWAAAGTLGVLALAAFLPSRERRGGGARA